jgi:outer membrane protein assembly factor BamB
MSKNTFVKSMSSFLLLSLVLTIALALNPTPAMAQTTDSWTMFRGDVAHTGYSQSSTPETFTVAWKYKTDGITLSSPAAVGDKVYIGSYDGCIYCLNSNDGSLAWKYKTEGSFILRLLLSMESLCGF